MKTCNYKCFITDGEFRNIHHLKPFREIVTECFELLNISQRENVNKYTELEMNLIVNKIRELHEFYGIGVCLSKEKHKEFHDKYGYSNCTKENFIEYCLKFYNINFEEKINKLSNEIYISKKER